MAMAILPAVVSGGRTVASAMPSLIKTVKQYAPSAYRQLTNLTGSKSPVDLASNIAKTGNGMQAQGLMFNALAAGVPIEMVNGAVPVLSEADLQMMAKHHVEYVKAERAAVDATRISVASSVQDVVAPSAEVVNRIEGTCKTLGITSLQMAELIVAFETTKSTDIGQYQAYWKKVGKVPL